MRVTSLFLLAVVGLTTARGPFRVQFHEKDLHPIRNGIDPGEPLFLTPYIQKGDIKTAQTLSQVGPLQGTTQKSYAGFLTVNKAYDSNMFFWFFPAKKNPSTAPVVLWLQGGPGGSSLFGLFVENGPFTIDLDLNLKAKPVTWNEKYSMLYIDNPVGTGFSFTELDAGYSTNETEVAINLYSALTQFFTMFPQHAKNDFYLTGESYAGKYIPAIAYRIMQQGSSVINLKGVAIGDGFTDPESMLPEYADYLFNLGLLDENQRNYFAKQTDLAVQMIQKKQYLRALATWDCLLNGDVCNTTSFFNNATGLSDYYNFLRDQSPKDFDYYPDFLQLPQVRQAIHVGNLTYHAGNEVELHLAADMLQSTKPWLEAVMNKYRVLIYSGQLDIIVAQTLTEAMLQTMQWDHADEYKAAPRAVWRIKPADTEVAGYVRNVHDFYQVIVRAGGHILPYDQPERSYDMIDRFISGRSFN